MAVLALALAYASLSLDFFLLGQRYQYQLWRLFSGDAETARNLLSTLLSGIITVTSLVVSITIVVLSLAAGQLGPRVIWNFIGNRSIQTVIGLFIGTILYLLIVLRTLTDNAGQDNLPHVAITVGSMLSVACLFALLLHVSKLARAIVSDTVVREIADQLDNVIAKMPDVKDDQIEYSEADIRSIDFSSAEPLALARTGYVQSIDYEGLCQIGTENDFCIRVSIRPGEFGIAGISYLHLAGTRPNRKARERLLGSITIGPERTPTQDLSFSMSQLVEIALRAMSQSLNDPFTAVAVIDRLAAALAELDHRRLRPPTYKDQGGSVRVILETDDWPRLLDSVFNPIRYAARTSPIVLDVLARRFCQLRSLVSTDKQRPLIRHLRAIESAALLLGSPDGSQIVHNIIRPALSAEPDEVARARPSIDDAPT